MQATAPSLSPEQIITRRQQALAWALYRHAPNAWCRDILNSPNDPAQHRILAEVAAPRGPARIFVASGHGIGKTHFVAKAGLHAGATWGRCRIPCTAPKEDTLLDRLWPELHKILGGASPVMRGVASWSKTKVTFYGQPGWAMMAETARATEGLAGHHENRVLGIVEEATGVDDEFWPAIEGWLTTAGSKLLCISNPTRTVGTFARTFRNGGPGVKLFRISWNPRGIEQDSPKDIHRPYSEKSEGGAEVEVWYSDRPDGEWARRIIAREGWDSTICRVRVRGLPPLTDTDSLVGRVEVYAAQGREPRPEDVLAELVWTWDVAGAGRDRSVLAARRGSQVLSIVVSNEPNTAFAVQQILEEIQGLDVRPDELLLDAIGIGAGPADQISAAGFNPRPVNVGASAEDGGSTHDERASQAGFANLRALAYWRLRMDFREGRIAIAPGVPRELIESLAEELEATRWKFNLSNKIQIIPKDEIKKALGRSPDIADALMLYYAKPASSGVGFGLSEQTEASLADW